MDKLNKDNEGSSLNIVQDNIEKLKTLFPDSFSEGKIDFDKLRANLGDAIETGDERMDAGGRATHGAVAERYNFTWHGKTQARRIAQTPSTGTLRPCKDESKN